ncbi:unnamed protein product [Clonostachys rosea]|uniref:Uncharacterized protein n=1 Tax=Bionectria ochroleuca TaxID=29856 RepID=A0ABY6UN35_BIOOC|nr:unnamed protein product [Clonostachys rosea]
MSQAVIMDREADGKDSNAQAKREAGFTGVQRTLLATLVFRALDNISDRPLLGDAFASQTLSRIDGGDELLATAKGSFADRVSGLLPAMRAKLFDSWTADFCANHQGATILHLGCGLDARSLRVRWQGEDRLWVDLDVPEVAEVRKQVMEPPETEDGAEYRIEASSVTEGDWLAKIPPSRPVLVVMEGLLVYLAEEDVYNLLGAILQHFQQGGEIVLDATGTFLARCFEAASSRFDEAIPMRFPLDDAQILSTKLKGLKLETILYTPDLDGFSRLPFGMRSMFKLGQWAGVSGKFGSFVRYSF